MSHPRRGILRRVHPHAADGGGLCRNSNRERSGESVTFGLAGRSVNCVRSSGGRRYPPASDASSASFECARVARAALTDAPPTKRRTRATKEFCDVPVRWRRPGADDMATRAHARCMSERSRVRRRDARKSRSALRELSRYK
ncbi:hypothetical protein BE221DRAFT_110743 [Ostreococcus tauri]|uniref:Uncharacterized protein n=1 Tax=Ostreococcus tauri TaxID=70448 RepID=A0A1Y5IDQ1_OSTTA|nr:hypothetical protein BE221DRAFT_110743 [Ostreococcus tauri]